MADKKERIGVSKPHARKRATPFNRGTLNGPGPNAYHIHAATDGVPAASWWIGRSRGEFGAAVAQESQRMRVSRFGRSVPASVLEG